MLHLMIYSISNTYSTVHTSGNTRLIFINKYSIESTTIARIAAERNWCIGLPKVYLTRAEGAVEITMTNLEFTHN